jgi:spore coat protein U-like protein
MFSKVIKRVTGLAVATLLLSGVALAGSANQNMGVSSDVSNNCVFGSAPSMVFGAYDPASANAAGGADKTGTASIQVTCTTGAAATLALDNGQNFGSTRQMSDGATHNLQYSIFQDSSHTTAWSATSTEDYTGTGTQSTLTAYGLIAKGQNVPAGSYSDTVAVTVSF